MQVTAFIGRILFPRQPEWKRERKVIFLFKTVMAVLTILVVFILGLLLILKILGQNQIDNASPVLTPPVQP